jgi:phage shock protein A
MEADADLVNFAAKPTIEDEFEKLAVDEEIEDELSALKSELSGQSSSSQENEKN